MRIHIALGDLFEARADAVVVPVGPKLRLEGSIGNQARFFSTDEALQEINKHSPMGLGEALLVENWNGRYQHMILVTNAMFSKGVKKSDNYDFIFKLITKVIKIADDNYLRSVAIPLISTGAYKCNKQEVAKAIYDAIIYFDFKNEPEMEISMVFYEDSRTSYNTFIKYLQEQEFEYEPERLKIVKQGPIEYRNERFRYFTDDAIIYFGSEDKEKFRVVLESLRITHEKSREDVYTGVCSSHTYSAYIRGETMPKTDETLEKLAKNLELSEEEKARFFKAGRHTKYI